MSNQHQFDDNFIRTGTHIRKSVRSLPKGHFQQIKQMFEKQPHTQKQLPTIHERQQISVSSDVVFRLPVTDDEKLKHRKAKFDENIRVFQPNHRDYLAEYEEFRLKLNNKFNQPKTIFQSKDDEEQLLRKPMSLIDDNQLDQEIISYSTSNSSSFESIDFEEKTFRQLALSQRQHLPMSATIYPIDNCDLSKLKRLNDSNSRRTFTVHEALPTPLTLTPPSPYDSLKQNEENTLNITCDRLQPSTCFPSLNSLSSTGYDSNSSPSMKSKHFSIVTNNSNDLIIHSTCSSSYSSGDEQQQPQQLLHQTTEPSSKPWVSSEQNASFSTSIYNDDVFDSSNEPSPLISRTQIKLNQAIIEHQPVTSHRRVVVPNSTFIESSSSSSSLIHEPIIVKKSSINPTFTVQTTSFPDAFDDKSDKRIRRWNNIYNDRTDFSNLYNRTRRFPSTLTNSTGFLTSNFTNQQSSTMNQFIESRSNDEKMETVLIAHLPPKKPPRTFQHENSISMRKQNLVSSSPRDSHSPAFDISTRSMSCMDLTGGVSNVMLSNNILPSGNRTDEVLRRSSILSVNQRKQTISQESTKHLPTTTTNNERKNVLINSSKTSKDENKENKAINHKFDLKSPMKKGISEPNLPKALRSKSPFSPRGFLDRVKRILPLSSSKQSLNDKSSNNTLNLTAADSDDSTSTSSDNTDQIRSSRLSHVSRVKNVYNSLTNTTQMTSLFIDPFMNQITNELQSLYEYVVHILPEHEYGYISNGNGCLVTSNIFDEKQNFNQINFQYPMDANIPSTLKYFCFPDQYDTNNNNNIMLTKKSKQEYFRFTLTNMHGARQYGYCSRFSHKGLSNALCIVSPYDMIDIYERILATATELFLSYKDDHAKIFLKEIYEHRLPMRGDTIHISTTTVGLYTLKCEYNRRKPLIDSVTLLSLSTDTIIKTFSSILYEQKIIFIGNELGPLTRLINTFICLLYPFSWPHTYIPILPGLMIDIIQAPTPYIIGILRSCESNLLKNEDLLSQDSSDILIVDIDNDRVRSLSEYISSRNNSTANNSYRGSFENLHNLQLLHADTTRFQILPKIFKIELKQEIAYLRKTRDNLSLDECQQRLCDVFMSIFVQSCYNYKDYFHEQFQREDFLRSKQHTIELFLEWFTRTQLFEIFIRQKFESNYCEQYALTFDLACENYHQKVNKTTPQRITAKAVKRKSATRTNKQDHHF